MLRLLVATLGLAILLSATVKADINTIEGKLKEIDPVGRTITFLIEKNSMTMDISGNVKIMSDGEIVPMENLRSEQNVRIVYHAELEVVVKIEVLPMESDEKTIILFDGSDLEQWNFDPKLWKIVEGELIGESEANLGRGGAFFASKKKFSNFSVTYKFRVAYGNTGFHFRCTKGRESFQEYDGWQADLGAGADGILPTYFGPSNTRPIATPNAESLRRIKRDWSQDGWNEYTILCQGERMSCLVNGVKVMEWKDNRKPKAGHIAIHLHGKEATKIFIKEISLTEME